MILIATKKVEQQIFFSKRSHLWASRWISTLSCLPASRHGPDDNTLCSLLPRHMAAVSCSPSNIAPTKSCTMSTNTCPTYLTMDQKTLIHSTCFWKMEPLASQCQNGAQQGVLQAGTEPGKRIEQLPQKCIGERTSMRDVKQKLKVVLCFQIKVSRGFTQCSPQDSNQCPAHQRLYRPSIQHKLGTIIVQTVHILQHDSAITGSMPTGHGNPYLLPNDLAQLLHLCTNRGGLYGYTVRIFLSLCCIYSWITWL